jgi:hypothetical protein
MNDAAAMMIRTVLPMPSMLFMFVLREFLVCVNLTVVK